MYQVTSVTPNLLHIEIIDIESYDRQPNSEKLCIGSYVKISDDKGLDIIAIVQSFRIKDVVKEHHDDGSRKATFVVEAQHIGCFEGSKFKRGGQQIAIPPTTVQLASESDLSKIYSEVEDCKKYEFGSLTQNSNIRAVLDGDRFFGKHIAVVGSTGSGKSCGVAKILQEGIRPSDDQTSRGILNNSHIIIFDLHGEYAPAFPTAKIINFDNLVLPYWLMNSEELEEMFIENREQNVHNQISQFKEAVIANKKKYNKIERLTYDTPVYFSIIEVCRFINNQNRATKDAKTLRLAIKDRDRFTVDDKDILFEEIEFEEKKRDVFNGGPYSGDFDRFVSRLDTKMNDARLRFLLHPMTSLSKPYMTEDLGAILRQFIGYEQGAEANITIIDLSGIPFEVLSIVVSLISRLIFDFCFHCKKIRQSNQELPFLLVYEEAHNYIPQSEGAKYRSVKQSIERIAKEGRKYGLSLMIVSQRPSEISETIFSQCNNYVAMRLTNPSDQRYIQKLLPDSVHAITDALPILEKQEAIVLGDAICVPSIIRIDDITDKPRSADVFFRTEWQKDWLNLEFDNILIKMKMQIPQEDASYSNPASTPP